MVKIKPQKTPPKSRRLAELTAQQQMFIQGVLASKTFNITEAATFAGYKHPAAAGYKLMTNSTVAAAIGSAIARRIERTEVTSDRVVTELARVGFFNPKDLLTDSGQVKSFRDLPESTLAAVRSMRVTYKEEIDPASGEPTTLKTYHLEFHDKLGALSLLAKHLGMLDDRLKVEHKVDQGFLAQLISRAEADDGVIDGTAIEVKVNESESEK